MSLLGAIAVAKLAIDIGSSIIGKKSDDERAKLNAQLARQDLALSYQDINARYGEEQLLERQKEGQIAAESTRLAGEVTLGAAEGNVAGASVTAILHDVVRQESAAKEVIRTNLELLGRQADRQKVAAQQTAKARILQVQPGSWAATGLHIGGSVLDFADTHIRNQPKKGD